MAQVCVEFKEISDSRVLSLCSESLMGLGFEISDSLPK